MDRIWPVESPLIGSYLYISYLSYATLGQASDMRTIFSYTGRLPPKYPRNLIIERSQIGDSDDDLPTAFQAA